MIRRGWERRGRQGADRFRADRLGPVGTAGTVRRGEVWLGVLRHDATRQARSVWQCKGRDHAEPSRRGALQYICIVRGVVYRHVMSDAKTEPKAEFFIADSKTTLQE